MRSIKGVLITLFIMTSISLGITIGVVALLSFLLWAFLPFEVYFICFRLSVVFAVLLTAGFMLSKESK